ncbi:MAG: hypothetical protein JWQ68_546 [Cryobacterium sp.]|jgi:hypothetical protein|nr:hypothetical protein [Cryobacterium sp.]
MSVHLIGGGWTLTNDSRVYGPFTGEATTRARLSRPVAATGVDLLGSGVPGGTFGA